MVKPGDGGVVYTINDEKVFLEKGSPVKKGDNILVNKEDGGGGYSHGVSNIQKGDRVIVQPTIDDIIALHGGFLCHEETEWVWKLYGGPSGARDWFVSSDYTYPAQLWSNMFAVWLPCVRRVKYATAWEHCRYWDVGVNCGNITPDPFGTPDAIEQGVSQSEMMRQIFLADITRPNYLTESQPTSNPFGEDQICEGIDDIGYQDYTYFNSIYKPRVSAGPCRVQLLYLLQGSPWPASPGQLVYWRGAHGPWQVAVEVPLRSLGEGEVYYEEPPI